MIYMVNKFEYDTSLSQTDRRTDGQIDTALCVASRSKNHGLKEAAASPWIRG